MREVKTVHYLRAGQSLCGMPGVPRDWPAGEFWSNEEDDVTCGECLNQLVIERSSLEIMAVNGTCPVCHATDLHAGPQGGNATNFACFSCAHRFNASFLFIAGRVEAFFFERCGRLEESDRHFFRPALIQNDWDYVFGRAILPS